MAGAARWTNRVGDCRCFVVYREDENLIGLIDRSTQRVRFGTAPRSGSTDIHFLCSGLGAQYVGMARSLYESEPTFRKWIEWGMELALTEFGIDLRSVLIAEPPPQDLEDPISLIRTRTIRTPVAEYLRATSVAHPAVFLSGYALVRLLAEWGVRPSAVLGHSLGEYLAACVAGALRPADALRLVIMRALLIASVPKGAMLAVQMSADALRSYLDCDVWLAAINSRSICVVSGAEAGIASLQYRLLAEGIPCRQLETTHAFHSPILTAIAPAFRRELRKVKWRPLRIRMVSNLTGHWITDAEVHNPEYWIRHMCEPVLFEACVRTAITARPRVLMDLGPGSWLSALAREEIETDVQGSPLLIAVSQTSRESTDETARLLEAIGEIWIAGIPLSRRALARRSGVLRQSSLY
jgi:phthiocerol/phenolphthiocerol synthesis type-I polyketide synthase E